jgi:hypothetical protein
MYCIDSPHRIHRISTERPSCCIQNLGESFVRAFDNVRAAARCSVVYYLSPGWGTAEVPTTLVVAGIEVVWPAFSPAPS